jgi:hypothetical protein
MRGRLLDDGTKMKILHVHPRCAGRWRKVVDRGSCLWQCTGCRAAFWDSPEVPDEARWENTLGDLMELLAFEGDHVRLPDPYQPSGPRWR